MRKTNLLLFVILNLALALPAWAQSDRAQPGSDAGGARGGLSTASAPPSAPSNSMSTRGVSVGASTSQTGNSSSRDFGPNFSSVTSGRSTGGTIAPNLSGTSFNSVNTYYQWQDYLWRLRTMYMLDSNYFRRFLRNTEPLVTPQLMKLTLRDPLKLSAQLLQSVSELESMVAELQAGKSLNKQEISDKANEIRELAKKIRGNENLNFVDRRLETNLSKTNHYDDLGLDAIHQLREMTTDLNAQLKSMYSQTTTSTVSVSSLSQPSFESLSRGIEKLTKVIESSAKRL